MPCLQNEMYIDSLLLSPSARAAQKSSGQVLSRRLLERRDGSATPVRRRLAGLF
ncbi:hypothetical protein CV_0327 [Chromobacterium violaceum ATCC 12472]|uniref:Uncharacterized protein n=1 Tax=Chromobacterium violaceum (strain ATCC 12472 / DSM 30191 / JCM 1249 / CCUG 213 / NBRC 12614 / NCIMB 9131 / NCTC 9757 / MK) TaxID=243365 RepID=Q7P186_CHRVO|nr:hypothetical protein CV_0327 [Chromobacterium violaceum ATCC 12472]